MINSVAQKENNHNTKTAWLLGWFSLILLIPSTGQANKYLGVYGVFIYLLLGTVATLVCYKYVWFAYLSNATPQLSLWLAVVTFLGIIAVFSVIYPIANKGSAVGGSDRDEALNIAATELLKGKYPYTEKTYLNNPISPMPGAVLLSIPFVMLGNSAYQNLFWLITFLCFVTSYFGDIRKALLLLWTILIFSPVVPQQIVTGGDLLSNSIYVLFFAWLTIVCVCTNTGTYWNKIVSSIFLGIALSSRANFTLIFPLIFSIILQKTGLKWAITSCALTLASFVLVTAPFYLYAPESFSPLHTFDKISQFSTLLPFSNVVIPIASGVLAIALAFQRMDFAKLLRNYTAVQALPVLSAIILSNLQTESLNLSFADFGLSFLFSGVLCYWFRLIRKCPLLQVKTKGVKYEL